MSNADDEIETIIARLLSLVADEDKPPAMVVMAPDMGESILGNRGGFLHLAIASLKAARGEGQKFKDAPWVCQNDFDWKIAGLEPDADAHLHIPEKQTRFQRLRGEILGSVLLLAVFGLLAAGVVTIWGWVGGLFHS